MGSLGNARVPRGQRLQISNQSGTARPLGYEPHRLVGTSTYPQGAALDFRQTQEPKDFSCKVQTGLSKLVWEKMGLE